MGTFSVRRGTAYEIHTEMKRFHIADVKLVSDGETVQIQLSCSCGHWDRLVYDLVQASQALLEHVNDPHPYAE